MENKSLQVAVDTVAICGGNKSKAAQQLGMPRTTLLDWLRVAEQRGIQAKVLPPEYEFRLGAIELEYKDRVAALEAKLKAAQRTAISGEYVREHIFEMAKASAAPPLWPNDTREYSDRAPGVPTLFLSDFHWGEVVRPTEVNGLNKYNAQIARDRLIAVVQNAIHLLKYHVVNPNYPGIVLILGGDMVSGDIHEELTETNEAPSIPIVFDLFNHLVVAINSLADCFGRVFIPAVYGNHGRTTHKKRYKGAAWTSYDWLLYTMLEKHFTAQGDERVRFVIPEGFDVVFKIANHSYLLTHGDRLGARGGDGIIGIIGPVMRGVNRIRGFYQSSGVVIDTVLIGHYHTLLNLPRIIVNGSLKGYDEFAMGNRLEPDRARQALWLTHPEHGRTIWAPVLADKGEQIEPEQKDWVTWKT